MKKINIKTIYLVAVISIGLICLAIGSTYAMFTTSAEINNPITISSNLTSNDDTMETFEVEVSPSATVTKTINISSGTVSNVNYSVWYINDISNIDIGVSSTSYTTAGTISNANTTVTTKISIRNNSSTTKTVTLGVALSKNSIVLASNMSLVPQKTLSNPLATHITNGLMKDADGNIRYSGLGDRNYVLFNCNTYPNTSCETWRIIGVFDGKVKLIRNESIGTYPWDNKDTTTGAEADYGSNDWTTARLMKLLNPGYTKESVNNSLYYNSKGGQCYAGANNAETPCDFTYTGIKNDTTRNMIADAKWSLLGWLDEGVNVYADQSYKLENTSGTVYTGNKTSWTGKIALPYPSDYAYSAYLGKCTSTLGEYSNCSSWMKTMFNSKTIALLTPIVSSSFVFHVAGGCLDLGEPYAALDSEIFPTLYLNTNVSIKTGSGTLNSPYQLSVG